MSLFMHMLFFSSLIMYDDLLGSILYHFANSFVNRLDYIQS